MKKLLLLMTVLLYYSSIMKAQNANLSVQGVLRTSEGDAVENGDYEITFKLYTEPTTGNPIWEETIEEVNVKGGVYSVVLGANGKKLDAEFDVPYYLGVTIDGGSEMIPRAKLTSSPYALSLIGEDNIFPNSGNVGVGDADPQTKLSVRRKNAILGLEADSMAEHTATISTVPIGMQFNAGGTDKTYHFEEGTLQVDGSIQVSNNTQVDGTFEANGSVVLSPVTDAVVIDKNAETLKLVGTDHSYLSFFPQGTDAGRKGRFGFINQDSIDIVLENENSGGDIKIITLNGDLDLETPNGRVAIKNRLDITTSEGGPFTFPTSHRRYHNAQYYDSGTTDVTETVEEGIGLGCNSDIAALGFRTWSDQRIKKDLKLSNQQKDLNTLKQIQVTDYRHIDEYHKGIDFRKGLIAQQVRSVFPEAVLLNTDYIPNIYSFPSQIDFTDQFVKITLKNPHNLKVDDKVKIVTPDGQENMMVQNINDDFSFSVAPKDIEIKDEVFVYGKEVDDFHSVDYDRVFTLAVSATQELARKVEALEKENARLKNKSTNAEQANVDLKAELRGVNKRLQAIELMLNATGSK